MDTPPKRAAVDPDQLGEKRLSEISAAEFLKLLEDAEKGGAQASPEEATVRDVIVGARAARRLPVGGMPEKKKVEREKLPLEKLLPEKSVEFPEKKKVELEKQQLENLPEKKKVELEKPHVEQFPEKKKVELEKQQVEVPPDVLAVVQDIADRLAAIEEQISKPSS